MDPEARAPDASAPDASDTTPLDASPGDSGLGAGAATTEDAGSPPQDAGTPHAPLLAGLSLGKRRVVQGATDLTSMCFATDEDGDTLRYEWTAAAGSFADAAAKSTTYTASTVGLIALTCRATDGGGLSAQDSASVRVYPEGIVTMLPFSRDATDASGNGNGATLNGAVYTTDADGSTESALAFDGVDDNATLDNARVYYALPGVTFVATLSIAAANHTRTIFTKGTSGYGLLSLLLTPDDDASSPRTFVVAQDNLLMKPTPSTAITVTGYTPPLGTYVQVALTRANTGLVRLYVDGRAVYTGSGLPQLADPNTSPVMLG
ncbi:MAG TPA: LamG-like jellyroll fold domain-containing protein, partial [Polyangiales bacterium]